MQQYSGDIIYTICIICCSTHTNSYKPEVDMSQTTWAI